MKIPQCFVVMSSLQLGTLWLSLSCLSLWLSWIAGQRRAPCVDQQGRRLSLPTPHRIPILLWRKRVAVKIGVLLGFSLCTLYPLPCLTLHSKWSECTPGDPCMLAWMCMHVHVKPPSMQPVAWRAKNPPTQWLVLPPPRCPFSFLLVNTKSGGESPHYKLLKGQGQAPLWKASKSLIVESHSCRLHPLSSLHRFGLFKHTTRELQLNEAANRHAGWIHTGRASME